MTKKDLDLFKSKLTAEKARLEADLSKVGRKDPSNPNGWDATTTDIEVDAADENEVADKFEEYEENNTIIPQLEKQLKEVDAALEKIEKGTYGKCEVCGEPIEATRLQANPSARVSIKHKH